MKIINKKAAMFGLDARIALAIFGALSVISGAALYSAIQQAKVVQWQTYFNELSKASEAYYFDTGQEIPITTTSSMDDEWQYMGIINLIVNDSGVGNWNGPYMPSSRTETFGLNDFGIRSNMSDKIHPNGSFVALWLRNDNVWSSSSWNSAPRTSELCVINDRNCYEWWAVNGNGNVSELLKIFNLLDEAVDNEDGAYAGSVRYSTYQSDWLFVKGRPRVYRGV